MPVPVRRVIDAAIPARISHQLSAAAGDTGHPAVFSRLGALDVPSSTPPSPLEARPGPPASSVACAMGPDSRRHDDGDVPPSPRSGNEEDGAMPPQPFGPMGVVADLFVARRRRCTGIEFLLAPRSRLTSPIGGRHWGSRAGPLGRKPHWAQRLAGLATKAGEICGLAAAVVSLLITAGCASAPATTPPARLDFPAPNTGPGRPDLDRVEQQQIDKGWQALLAGNPAMARSSVSQTAPNPAAELLTLQADIVAGIDNAMPGLERLTTAQSEYAAAWLTLSVAAESAEDEAAALEAASRGAQLWPDKRWFEREQRLHQRWVGDRIDSARELYESDRPEDSIEALEPALNLDPDNRDAVLLKARVLIALDQLDRAEAALSGLPRDPEVVRLSGNIAEARGDLSAAMRIYSSLPEDSEAVLRGVAIAESQGDWLSAMNLYRSLSEDRPEKGPGLRRAKLRWRVSVMPEYVREAISSPMLDRAQLAVVVVILAPRVETMPGGQVPLLSDVMTLPSQEQILTAARLGLIESDQFLHRFHPQRPVTAAEVRFAVDNLGLLLNLEGPRWCENDVDDQPCAEIVEPVSGESVAGIVIELVTREGEDE